MGEFGIGQSVPREEDPYLVRGEGRYVDDVSPAGQARAYVLRSVHAHAALRAIDVTEARSMPGVLLVLTAFDPEVAALGMQKPHMPRRRRDGSPAPVLPQPMLPRTRVRYLGEPVAFVVAETLAQAKDAAETIAVDYEVLPAVTSMEQAAGGASPALWPECPDNQPFLYSAGDADAVARGFAEARHVARHRIVISRLTTNPMEPRGCLAEYDLRDDRYVIRCGAQNPHTMRRIFAREIFAVPETRFRVISENVGGGFGMKGAICPEYALCALSARLIRRPVKWIAERSESFLSDEHARDNITDAELALDADGRILALRVRTLANLGAYFGADRSATAPTACIGVLAGTYTIPAIHVEVAGVLTNTVLTGPYRGAGRPEAAFVIETMVDMAARQLGIDPAELRRRNTIPAAAMPYRTALIYTYDCGDFGRNLSDCLSKSDYAGFPARRAAADERGKLRGIGISNTVESSTVGLMEHAELRFDANGALTVAVGTHDHGQGHATTFRQIVAERLGIPPHLIRFTYGDTDRVAFGIGTFGSRSAVAASTALLAAADKIIAKGKTIAAHLLEAGEEDIQFAAGKFVIAGTDRAVDFAAVARAAFQPIAKGVEPGLYDTGAFDGGERTFPNGCHISEVEIDPETGAVEIVRYTAVDDVGNMINPMLVEGQLHGGIAMGVGQALLEQIAYDEGGQLVSGSFMDYGMPRAGTFCTFALAENVVPTKTNPLGVKGAGESGTVGALPSVMNAVNDALARVGAPPVQMPATPHKVWTAIQSAKLL